jgi:hypothetical protein
MTDKRTFADMLKQKAADDKADREMFEATKEQRQKLSLKRTDWGAVWKEFNATQYPSFEALAEAWREKRFRVWYAKVSPDADEAAISAAWDGYNAPNLELDAVIERAIEKANP